MDFRIDAQLPATAAQLWAIFFDVQRVAALIPGCEKVTEVEPLKDYSAVMKQRIGPFKLEVPTRIAVESHVPQRNVVLRAAGRDKVSGTTLDVLLEVQLEETQAAENQCRLALDAQMQVAGRLASLGYPVVKKRSEEIFAEFEKRLRQELDQIHSAFTSAAAQEPEAATGTGQASIALEAEGTDAALAVAPSPRASARTAPDAARSGFTLSWPRAGLSMVVGVAVAWIATALGQSPWWWLVAPLLGLASGIGRKDH